MYCPNCSSSLHVGASDCSVCSASFAEGSSWAPQHQPSQSATKDPGGHAFTRAAFLVFLLLGPSVPFLSSGEGARALTAGAFIFIYIFGVPFALVAWVGYSASLLIYYSISERQTGQPHSLPWLVEVLIRAALGAFWGFAVWTTFNCSIGRDIVGGWGPCFARSLTAQYSISLIPGAVCGALASIFTLTETTSFKSRT